MKRKVLVPLLLSLLLSGCSANVPEEATTSSSSQKQMTSETVESSQSSLSDTKLLRGLLLVGLPVNRYQRRSHQRLQKQQAHIPIK